jgi:hypothetical protein
LSPLEDFDTNISQADYRFTRYEDIERWWEIVCSAYLMVSLHSESLRPSPPEPQSEFASHPGWDNGKGWKNILNNLRLILQPFTLFNLIQPWLSVFLISHLSLGFAKLQSIVYRLTSPVFIFLSHPEFYFSSA